MTPSATSTRKPNSMPRPRRLARPPPPLHRRPPRRLQPMSSSFLDGLFGAGDRLGTERWLLGRQPLGCFYRSSPGAVSSATSSSSNSDRYSAPWPASGPPWKHCLGHWRARRHVPPGSSRRHPDGRLRCQPPAGRSPPMGKPRSRITSATRRSASRVAFAGESTN